MTDWLFGLVAQVARWLTRAGAGPLYPARMRSTVLYGLHDADIPQDFSDEVHEAEDQERRANQAILLNALLLAGWVPPSRATQPST
jgi:hypothetical protein